MIFLGFNSQIYYFKNKKYNNKAYDMLCNIKEVITILNS